MNIKIVGNGNVVAGGDIKYRSDSDKIIGKAHFKGEEIIGDGNIVAKGDIICIKAKKDSADKLKMPD